MSKRCAVSMFGAFLVVSTSVSAALKPADCDRIGTWAKAHDGGKSVQVTSRLSLDATLLDPSFDELFGRSLWSWDKADFRQAQQALKQCDRQAARARDKEARANIRSLMKRVAGARSVVLRTGIAAQNARAAVETLVGLRDSAGLRDAIDLAVRLLQAGENDRRALRGLSYDYQRPLGQLARASQDLRDPDRQSLLETLQERRAAVVAALEQEREAQQAAQQAAARERLVQAAKELEALPDSAAALPTLDRLAGLSALEQVPAAEAEAFRARLLEKRQAVQAATAAQQQADREALSEARSELAALPLDGASLAALDRLAALPALRRLPPSEVTPFRAELTAKRQAIDQALRQRQAAQLAEKESAAVEQLEAFGFSEPADLGRFWKLGSDLGSELRKAGMRGRGGKMNQIFWRRLSEESKRLLPAFEAQLKEIPATTEGARRIATAVADLTGIERKMPLMKPYYAAAQRRSGEIAQEMRAAACRDILGKADVSDSEAAQPLWGAGKPTTLGEFLCAMSERGVQLHEYEGSGLFSSEHSLKLTTRKEGLHTLKLHEGEVQPGKEMLVGFELADANQSRALTVKEWERYVARQTGVAGKIDCQALMDRPPQSLSIQERMQAINCVLQAIPPAR